MNEARIGLEHEKDDEGVNENVNKPGMIKRKDCMDGELETDTEIVNFRDSPEFQAYTWLIYPDDKAKVMWDLLIITLVLETLLVYPYRLSFSDSESMSWAVFEYCLDFIFFLDCLLTFFSCFYSTNSELVVKHSTIATHYLKFWFWVDLLSFFPFELFTNSPASSSSLFNPTLKPLYRALRVLKLIRITKLWSNSQLLQELKDFLIVFRFKLTRLKLLCIGFMLFCHISSCFWCMLPLVNPGSMSWEIYYNLQDFSDIQKYFAGVYWVITTICTIGFGDIVPTNTLEISVTICVMSAGVFFYSYTISSITTLMAENNYQNILIKDYTDVLQGIANEHQLSKEFHKRLNEALIYNLSEKRADFSTLITSLPPKIAAKLKFAMNSKLLEHNTFFYDKPRHFVQRILEFLIPFKVEAWEFIYKTGSLCDELYFLLSGEVVFVFERNIVYETVNAGGYFGDAELFLCEERETNVMATKRSKMLTLDREILLTILKDYEKVKLDMIVMSMIKRKQLVQNSIGSGTMGESEGIHISQQILSGTQDEDAFPEFVVDCSSSLETEN